MKNLSRVIDTQIRLYQHIGPIEHFVDSERFLNLLNMDIPDFKELFHNTRAHSMYLGEDHLGIKEMTTGLPSNLGEVKPSFTSWERVNQTLNNFDIGLDLINEKHAGYFYEDELTFRLKKIGDKMVEALWACPITYKGQIIGKVGLNFHYEGSKLIASISNIQGKNSDYFSKIKNELIGPIWAIEAVDQIILNLPKEVDLIRGVASKNHMARHRSGFNMHTASNLYDRTFRSDEIGMYAVLNEKKHVLFYEKSRAKHI